MKKKRRRERMLEGRKERKEGREKGREGEHPDWKQRSKTLAIYR